MPKASEKTMQEHEHEKETIPAEQNAESCGCGEHHHHHHEDGESCGCGEHHHHHHEDGEPCGCGEHHHHHHEDGESCGCGEHHHHHHEDGEACGCGEHHHHHHEDGEPCGCGEHHHHHHEDGEACGCGEHHHHHHEDGEPCGCGEHHHHHHEHTQNHGGVRRVYIIEHLDCANCAAKIERKINELPEVEEATLTFATKQLRVTAKDPDALLEQMRQIARTVEPGATIEPRPVQTAGNRRKVYIIEHLDCANCAAKIERKINELPEVEEATLTFATKQLRVTAKNPDALLEQMRQIARTVEPDATIEPRQSQPGLREATYIIEHLDCANCAAKIERKINELPEVEEATLTFATKQLRVTAKDPDALLEQMRQIARSVEPDATIEPRQKQPAAAAKQAGHKEDDGEKQALWAILAGAALFVLGEVCSRWDMPLVTTGMFLVAYVILGGKVLLTAGKNLTRGHVFDENFLMSLATLGALVIGEFAEAVGVMLFYRVGEYFEHRAVEKSRSQIMEAVDLRPEVVELVEGESVRTIGAAEAQVGDIVQVRPGDRIPLDGVVLEGESRIDTSPVTGEPVPVKVTAGDSVTSGCVNTSGLLKVRVEKVLEESMVTRILDSVENAAASKPKIDRFITRFARIYTPFVVALALATAIIPSLITGDWNKWVYTALTFLVISCPCALVLSVPLAFFAGIGAGSKKGILFKGGVSLEAMRHVRAVVMDKTGTITKGNFVVQQTVPAGAPGDGEKADGLLALAAACEKNSTHPIGTSIVSAAQQKGLEVESPSAVEEIAGQGIRATVAAGQVLCGNRKLMERFQVPLGDHQDEAYGTEVLVTLNGQFLGYLLIADTLKEDAAAAIGEIKGQGIRTVMLTGDAQNSAEAVARQAGVDEVHARLLPEEKLTELQKIRQKNGAVMFVGDGINDAPVLAGADVGAAMGSGADAAIEAADVVFMTSAMQAVPQSLSIARRTNRIAWQNVVFALVVKALVMVLGLAGYANMWAAVFADTGVAMICVINSIRILYQHK